MSSLRQLPVYLSKITQGLQNLITPAIPAEVLDSSAACLVHVSDTPATFYPVLFRLLKKLRPAVLVHTGDLLDQIKLENNSYLVGCYQEQLERYLPQLEGMPVDDIYLVPGNHDDTDILADTCRRCCLIPPSSLIRFGSFKIGVAHKPQQLPANADFGLYGHCLDQPTVNSGHPLSGLTKINLLLENGTLYSMPYPRGINAARGLRIRPAKL